jgi:hypothetical protein
VSAHIYVDESKAKGYLLVAATVVRSQASASRRELGSLILPGQRGLHMRSESDSRRREIADSIVRIGETLGVDAVIFDAGRSGTEKDRRSRCLEAIIANLSVDDQVHIVLDLDESLQNWDRQRLIELTRAAGLSDRITYEHRTRHSELLLAIPDAIAWCWARGGDWRRRIRPVVRDVREMDA